MGRRDPREFRAWRLGADETDLSHDPACLRKPGDGPGDGLRGYDRSPEAEPSPHLWRGALPTKLAAGEHLVEVRAFDRWRGEVRASTRYRLVDAVP